VLAQLDTNFNLSVLHAAALTAPRDSAAADIAALWLSLAECPSVVDFSRVRLPVTRGTGG